MAVSPPSSADSALPTWTPSQGSWPHAEGPSQAGDLADPESRGEGWATLRTRQADRAGAEEQLPAPGQAPHSTPQVRFAAFRPYRTYLYEPPDSAANRFSSAESMPSPMQWMTTCRRRFHRRTSSAMSSGAINRPALGSPSVSR